MFIHAFTVVLVLAEMEGLPLCVQTQVYV